MAVDLWEHEVDLKDLDIDVPAFFSHHDDPNTSDVMAVYQSGCDSGAWINACTCHLAMKTMLDYGNEVLDFLERSGGEVMVNISERAGWFGLACHLVSRAVEEWCILHKDDVECALEEHLAEVSDE
jgi:hypothetical protein